MRTKIYHIILYAFILTMAGYLSVNSFASVDASYIRTAVTSRVDLRKYFEEAMSLFESGKYKEAIAILEKLIDIEKSSGESYFTPFAEIYIDKSRDRMAELMILEEKKLERMKKKVVNEAAVITKQRQDAIIAEEDRKRKELDEARKKELYAEETKRKALEEAKKSGFRAKEDEIKSIYERAMGYYRVKNYPSSIVEFKKIKEIDSSHPLASQAESYITLMQQEIKKNEERMVLVRMEEARAAKIEMEREKERNRIAAERDQERKRIALLKKEKEKEILRQIFEQRLKLKEARDMVRKITGLTDTIINNVREKRFEEAEVILGKAMQEFPEHERFKDILHYVSMQKIKLEEDALKRARELTEEKMLLDVAEKHLLPEEKTGALEKEKKITPIVKIPEIRKRLKIPISVDFKDVELDYVLSFLSDATGVNIVPSSEIDTAQKKVTIRIKDMPLEDALRYILKSQELVYRIEEDAVWVATKEEMDNEKIDTRVYFLNQGIGKFSEFSAATSTSSGESSEASSKASTSSGEVKTVKNILENAVDWPKDSKLTLDERTGALIISNTPSNLEAIENLLYNLDITPVQVLIEARFLEVKVSDIDDLGVEWKLDSAWGVKVNNARQPIHGFASSSGVNFSDFDEATKDQGFNLTYQGILSHPQFHAVMHALQQKENVKTLSAPRITTLNNQTATIEVVEEYIYPTRYEVSLVQYDINGDGDFDDAGETEWANIPQDFVTRDVGILLHVKPSVGSDKKSITLALTPEVSEYTDSNYEYSGSVTIPSFKTRNLSTSVIVNNGQTVVMGGLIKETNTKVKTKVPLLGDLPLVGGLFRKSTDFKERRNLLIFVTASIMDNKADQVASSVEK